MGDTRSRGMNRDMRARRATRGSAREEVVWKEKEGTVRDGEARSEIREHCQK